MPSIAKSNYLAFFNGVQLGDVGIENDPSIQAAFGINRGARLAQIEDGTSHTMLMSAYKIKPPTAMFGALHTGDEVVVHAELVAGPLTGVAGSQ